MTLQSVKGWTVETLHDEYAQALREDAVLYDSNTEHQRLRVFENARLGRVLTLDGVVQTTEGDEFMYHEMLAHVPILAHGSVKRVLIIGGGDGGMAREVLRHKSVMHCTMVEIDAGVVDFSKEHLPALSNGVFDDSRLDLVITDGAAFMAGTHRPYDVIIVDSTDPIGPGEVLFTNTFYANAKKLLTADGILVTQNGVPFLQPDELHKTMTAFRGLFPDWGCYLTHVPTYAGGPMALGWASLSDKARNTDANTLQQRAAAANLTTRYYNTDVHRAAFALPEYIARLLR